jgi:hypothetical protein
MNSTGIITITITITITISINTGKGLARGGSRFGDSNLVRLRG